MHQIFRDTLTSLESRLDPAQFVRVHRSAIINVDRIGYLTIDREVTINVAKAVRPSSDRFQIDKSVTLSRQGKVWVGDQLKQIRVIKTLTLEDLGADQCALDITYRVENASADSTPGTLARFPATGQRDSHTRLSVAGTVPPRGPPWVRRSAGSQISCGWHAGARAGLPRSSHPGVSSELSFGQGPEQ